MSHSFLYTVTVYQFENGSNWVYFSGNTYPCVGEPEGGWQGLAEKLVNNSEHLVAANMPDGVFDFDYEVEDYTVEVSNG